MAVSISEGRPIAQVTGLPAAMTSAFGTKALAKLATAITSSVSLSRNGSTPASSRKRGVIEIRRNRCLREVGRIHQGEVQDLCKRLCYDPLRDRAETHQKAQNQIVALFPPNAGHGLGSHHRACLAPG